MQEDNTEFDLSMIAVEWTRDRLRKLQILAMAPSNNAGITWVKLQMNERR